LITPIEGRKSTRSQKEPGAPKRAVTPYIAFFAAKRSQILKDKPELKFGEVGALIAQMWNGLSDEEKAPYVKIAEQDKERYAQERAEYEAKKAK